MAGDTVITVVGNLTADPELRFTASGAAVASFTIAQMCLVVSFAFQEPTLARFALAVVLLVPVQVLLGRRVVGALERTGMQSLAGVVVVYIVVISAMTISAITAGTALGIAGALCFLASDSLIAEDRFVEARHWSRVAIMVTYHLALAGLVLGQL